ncbi:aspartate carbamoyltransferase regulatory subunit [Candidatus Tachikawaea gelatinosa]|uniref:Aspartate carbamoyltransferase regulatory chain n=1 Tax=Candidatus Tachikawaea gelatinosa TaxID=1410383 RepID=A0A090ARL0_9ENTR|nr:aspartate carbamoyltransferase regulatory subunit [Candidatus Tachikawaea gelatinosa]BAP58430.1 aspartate carbamoyltransferase regulatory chain [Candidatus Tachikawaea gelatinosa]
MQDKKLQVEAIKCGTVIDHIPARKGFKLLSLFRFTETHKRITIGLNLPSYIMGVKDLIKIENTFLNNDQINQLAIFSSRTTVNCISEYKVVTKIKPILPKFIEWLLICPNINCISRVESIYSCFLIRKKMNKVYLLCKYCEKEFFYQIVMNYL